MAVHASLKGVRGVVTRRAGRWRDTTEVREIAQHYEAEPEFRDQINRYIHDFEAMLRRLLVDPVGSAPSVTILSSDMGKPYVALPQAIKRFRTLTSSPRLRWAGPPPRVAEGELPRSRSVPRPPHE